MAYAITIYSSSVGVSFLSFPRAAQKRKFCLFVLRRRHRQVIRPAGVEQYSGAVTAARGILSRTSSSAKNHRSSVVAAREQRRKRVPNARGKSRLSRRMPFEQNCAGPIPSARHDSHCFVVFSFAYLRVTFCVFEGSFREAYTLEASF